MADVLRLRRPALTGAADGDRGSAAVALVAMISALVFVAFAVSVPWGDAVASRTTSRTAADAAALAAADAWSDALHPVYARISAGDHVAASGLLATPPSSFGLAGVRAAAQQYADANDEDLVSLVVVARPGSAIGFEVTTRARHAVSGSDVRTEATSLAEARLDGGICLSGAGFGLVTHQGCLTAVPEPPASAPNPAPTTAQPGADAGAPVLTPAPAPPAPRLEELLSGHLHLTVHLVG